MNRIKQLRSSLGYTQKKLAAILNISRTTVTMWETENRVPDYESLKKLTDIFNISSDYIIGCGIYEHWDDVVKYYEAVSYALRLKIPSDLEMPAFDDEKFLCAWLDTRLYYEGDEIQLARWFSFAIKSIKITPKPNLPNGEPDADVSVEFTKEFQYIIDGHLALPKHEFEIVTFKEGLSDFLKQHGIEKPLESEDVERLEKVLANVDVKTREAIELLNQLNPDNLERAKEYIRFELARQGDAGDK
ncbi:MAG: hypothetical protein CVU91_13495 [Firmicutes bacterium HGW-Firmicutes-16]|nr:MAG: hypothetical protein CVU91_13495 [Firmicutes bacterium HGW-Firmicutes-16]